MIFIRAMTSPDEASRRRALLQRFRRLRFMLTDAWCPSPYHHLKYREKRKRETEENTYSTTQRACLETAPHSFPSLPLHTCTNSLDPFLCVCLAVCLLRPVQTSDLSADRLNFTLFSSENTEKGQFFMLLPAYFCLSFSVITLFMSMAINCCQLLLMY